jgi:hypothetical protein
MKAPYDLPNHLKWQNKVVVITQENKVIEGDYDGYGSLEYVDVEVCGAECWHHQCWMNHQQPKTFTEASNGSYDQGYFYGEEE